MILQLLRKNLEYPMVYHILNMCILFLLLVDVHQLDFVQT